LPPSQAIESVFLSGIRRLPILASSTTQRFNLTAEANLVLLKNMTFPFFPGLRYYFRRLLGWRYKISPNELPELQQLSMAVFDYIRMLHEYSGASRRRVVVSVFDLAIRFRETPDRIEAALSLPNEGIQVRSAGWGHSEVHLQKQSRDIGAA
jgi:hypothetical protein